MKIRFIHVPKTAGTTVLSILNLQYPLSKKFVFRGRDSERWGMLSPDLRRRIPVISGHAPLRTGFDDLDLCPSFILLRHPIERAASFCRHILDPKKKHYLREEKGLTSIDGILDQPDRGLINLQTSMLLLNQDEIHSLDPYTFNGMDAPVDKAFDILAHDLHAFGIQEQFDTSMLLIAHAFRWRYPPIYLNRNISDRSLLIDFTPNQTAKLEQLNALDIELYDRAKRRFCELVERADWLAQEHSRFECWQKVARPLLKLHQIL